MQKSTVETYVGRKITCYSAFGESVKGTLQSVSDDSLTLEMNNGEIWILALAYVARIKIAR